MKAEEVRDLSIDEIDEKVEKLKKELFSLRVQAKIGKLEKQSRIKALRRDIARLLTVQNEIKNK